MSNNQKTTINAVRAALSAARMGTFEAAAGVQSDDDPAALLLYAWNAEVSGAFLAPLHVCEVVIRNAVSDALEPKPSPALPPNPAACGVFYGFKSSKGAFTQILNMLYCA
jgi:hypothetical protein